MKKIFLMLSAVLAVVTVLFSASASAAPMWRCVATDARGATWYQYSATRAGAATGARSRCRAGSYRATCRVNCFRPIVRWRCVSADRAGRTWYWISSVKSTAITNARASCNNNSTVGGCSVAPGACSAS